jgi:hypothetical protein
MLPPTVTQFPIFMQRTILYFLLLFGLLITAVRAELTSGPMIAHLDMREGKDLDSDRRTFPCSHRLR